LLYIVIFISWLTNLTHCIGCTTRSIPYLLYQKLTAIVPTLRY